MDKIIMKVRKCDFDIDEYYQNASAINLMTNITTPLGMKYEIKSSHLCQILITHNLSILLEVPFNFVRNTKIRCG